MRQRMRVAGGGSAPPTQVSAGGTVLTLSSLAAGASLVRSGSSLISAIAGLSNVVYVSKAGTDATGQRGNIALPFLTIAAALTNSNSGDVIVVGPGTFTENLTWSKNRSLLGHGSRQTIISGTITLTETANGDAEAFNFADVQITGVGTINFGAKTGGDVLFEMRDCILGSAWTFTRPVNGAYTLGLYNTRNGNAVNPNGFNNVIVSGCELGTLGFSASAGAESVRLHGSKIDTVTFVGAGSYLRIAGCTIVSALTFTDAFGGAVWTTGCELLSATITINSGTWHEYGCTFTQANIAGASGNKRVSYQRIASANYAAGVSVVTLPVALGSTNYVVCVEQNSQAGGAAYNVLVTARTGTTFTINNTSPAAEDLTFGIFYRA